MMETNANKTNKIRVSLDIENAAYEKLKDLKKRSNSSTIAEVFRKAISLYQLFLTRQEEGFSIYYEKGPEKNKVEIIC